MKNILHFLSISLFLVIIASCGKDNYDEPGSSLTGQIVYNGEALQVRGTGEAVQLQLYQDGFDKKNPINVYVGQDGAFAASLFNGEYKLVTRDNNGPWVNSRDTTIIQVKGTTEIKLEVTPYFTISGANLSVSSSAMNASFTINKIVSSAEIERVMLILSATQFADDVNNVFRKDFSDISAGSVNLSADISGNSNVSGAKSLFARVGVLAKGADQAIYSTVTRIR